MDSTLDDPVANIAKATAQHLATTHGPTLPFEVDAALHARNTNTDATHGRYTDPVAIATLIVTIATLAWTIYTDLRKTTPNPPPDTLARNIRLQLTHTHTIDDTTNTIIDITTNETLNHGVEPQ